MKQTAGSRLLRAPTKMRKGRALQRECLAPCEQGSCETARSPRGFVAYTLCIALLSVTNLSGCRALSSRDTRVLSSARQLSLRGAEALQQRRYTDAESLFVEALRQSPNDERAQWGYSEVLWHLDERQLATAHMQQAVILSGANPDLLVRLGQMYLEQENFQMAEEQAEAALKSHRKNPSAWSLKADVLRCKGDLNGAITCYQLALINRPDWPEVQVTLAELYRLTDRPRRALATLDRMTDQRSDTQIPPRAFLLRGQALADLGQREAALVCLRQAAPRISPDQSDLLYEFAQTQYQLGDLVEARLCLGRALQKNPESASALQLQSEIEQLFERPGTPNVPAVTVSSPTIK